MECFQALQAGQYWKAVRHIARQGIAAGEVLLIKSIRWVDDAPHTIILRPHPQHLGQYYEVNETDPDGKTVTRLVPYEEHRFLLKDFLTLFEFEPDHERVRAEELRQIQSKVTELQTELLEVQNNPARMALIVEEGLKEQAKEESQKSASKGVVEGDPGTLRQEVVSLATGSVAKAIESGLTEEGVAHIKAIAQREHQIATVKAKWIQAKTEQIAETIKSMTPFYEERAAAALAATEDVRTYVQKLSQGIESLDLYVGNGVEVTTLRSGASAPREEPLTFMQRKLLMDEEFAVWADVDEHFDFTRQSAFFDALIKNDSLVKQIFPTPRCVVVMATTSRELGYGDGWTNLAKNSENRKVFLLVRDGENIHRVISPVESHLGAARLFPFKDDQDRIFRGYDGRQIKFEDVAFTDRLTIHEQHALHYKRFLLLVCGLDHRLKLFGDFYDGPPSMQFMSLEFQEKYCRFLHDDPENRHLLGEARPPLSAWLEEKNAYLRSGSRVLCNWRELMNPSTAPAACKANRRRDSFDRRYVAKSSMEVKIAYREGSSLFVDVEVSGERRRDYGTREFTCKVNLSRFKDGYWSYTDLPFLCLDAVEPADLHWYIHNRATRRDHLSYIRFFKRALTFLTAERAAEQPTRDRLAQALEEGRIATGARALELVSHAVIAWRAAHRGKPLPRIEDGEKSAAWKSLLDQMYSIVHTDEATVREVEAYLESKGYAPLRLVLDGHARLKIYAAPATAERDDRLVPHSWVHCITLERGRTKLRERSRRWALLPASAASETTLHEWDGAKTWVFESVPFSTFEEKQKYFGCTLDFATRLKRYTESFDEATFERIFADWTATRRRFLSKSRIVVNPELVIPVGLVINKYRKRKPRFLCVAHLNPHILLFNKAPTQDAANQVRKRFIDAYAHKDAATREFESALHGSTWVLLELPASSAFYADDFIHHESALRVPGRPKCDPRLSVWLDAWRKKLGDDAVVWFAPGVYDETGNCTLDERLGIRLPDDFAPVTITEVELSGGEGNLPKYRHWFDVAPIVSDDEEDAATLWPKSREREHVPEGSPFWCSSREYHDPQPSPAAAEALLKRLAQKKQYRLVRANDLEDATAAPEGVDRWYVISDGVEG